MYAMLPSPPLVGSLARGVVSLATEVIRST